ncbi:MAG: imidazole glycerol phosphate synthase subunit HisH [Gaiellales bacterium]
MSQVLLVDYGAGNLRSLRAAFERLGVSVEVSGDAERISAAQRVVLPGVGAAGPAMRELKRLGLTAGLVAAPSLLGVCLGMQLLFERSAEGDVGCLGRLAGTVQPMDWARPLPHMGWNDVVPVRRHALAEALPAVCYFAHSYAVFPADRELVVAETEIGGRAVATMVADGGVTGVQFHPEKSGPAGRRLLEAWLEVPVAA